MECGEVRVHQRRHEWHCEPAGHHNECRHRHLDFACGREAHPVRRVMVVRVVLMRAGGISLVAVVSVVIVRVDLVNESDVLKQRVRRRRQPNRHQQHCHDCLEPLHAHEDTSRHEMVKSLQGGDSVCLKGNGARRELLCFLLTQKESPSRPKSIRSYCHIGR